MFCCYIYSNIIKAYLSETVSALAFPAWTQAYICQCTILLDFTVVPKTMGPKENYKWKEMASRKLKA